MHWIHSTYINGAMPSVVAPGTGRRSSWQSVVGRQHLKRRAENKSKGPLSDASEHRFYRYTATARSWRGTA